MPASSPRSMRCRPMARCRRGSISATSRWSPPRDASHGDLASNAALVLAKSAEMKPRDIADKLAEKLQRRRRHRQGGGGGPRLPQPELPSGLLARRRRRRSSQQGAGLWPQRSRPRRARQRGVRLGQPDGAAARRPRPRRRVRRRARQSPAVHRLRRDPRVLRQRRRRPGRYAGALGLSALPRGAGRGHRRDPGRALSRRLPQARRQGAGGPARPRPAQSAGGALAAARARRRRRGHDGDDQGRSRRPRHSPRRLLLRAHAHGRQGRGGRDHRGAARQGPRLPGAAREAQGPRRRGMGGSRADAVPVDGVRRRCRPRADEVGRQLHLFCRRHGLSPQQARARLQAPDQHVRRRSRRLPHARQGGGGGAVGRQGRPRHQGVPARQAHSAPASRCACPSAPAPS